MKRSNLIIFLSLTILFILTTITSVNASKFERDYVTYSSSTDNFGTANFALDIGEPTHENYFTGDDNSGFLIRGWIENLYENLVTESFTETREVIDHYDSEPIYEVGGATTPHSMVNYQNLTGFQCRNLEAHKDTGFWRDTFWGNRWPNTKVEPNSFQDTADFRGSWIDYGWSAFQGFGLWNQRLVSPDYYNSYNIWVPHFYNFLHKDGVREIPVYTTEEYTAYHNTLYEIIDYKADNWPSISIPIVLEAENGYEGNLEIDFEIDNKMVKGVLENRSVTLSSDSSTSLDLDISPELWNSAIEIKVTTTDGLENESENLKINLATETKPERERKIVNQWDSEIKPDEEGDSTSTYKCLIGVGGHVRDSETLEGVNEPLMTVNGCQFSGEGADHGGVAGIRVSRSDGSYIYATEKWPGQTQTFSVRADHEEYYSSGTKNATDNSNSDSTATKNFTLYPKGSRI